MRRPRFVPKHKFFSMPRGTRRRHPWFMYKPGVMAAMARELAREFYEGTGIANVVAVSDFVLRGKSLTVQAAPHTTITLPNPDP